MAREIQLPAPGRGAYDRSLSRPQRDAEHRERLLRATGELFGRGALTVARIVEHAGVGRSTFYEFFDGPEHLVAQLEQRVLKQLESALEAAFVEARTPLERVRAITRRCVAAFEAEPTDSNVALSRREEGALLSPAGERLRRALERCVAAARVDGAWFKTTDDVSVLAAAAAAEAVCRRHVTTAPIADAPRVLAELVIKLLR
jgi:AcrR family transcriptional regulator